jgi:transposase
MSKRTYKFRLYPTRKQAQALQWTLDRCRELYNAALQERKEAYKYARVSINYEHQANQLPDIKAIREEYNGIHSQVLQDTLRRVDKAFKAFFRRAKNGEKPGYPRYQGYNRYDSFTYPQTGFSLTHDHRVALSKIGSVKVKLHRKIEGTIKTCSIKREGEQWYVCFSCEGEDAKYLPNGAAAKGGLNKSIVDAGWAEFVAYCTYKAEYAGRAVLQVNPKYTSQICSGCGAVVKKELSERWHSCSSGCSLDRDHNAAINIKHLGLGRSHQAA